MKNLECITLDVREDGGILIRYHLTDGSILLHWHLCTFELVQKYVTAGEFSKLGVSVYWI
jgi:GH15 family glucan-1,4-alpha-glucosidase